MRNLASVRTIGGLRPIPKADAIEVALVDGWECVVKKGEFKEGEQIVYIEVDSIMPERPEYEFLRPRKFRVRTIRLRGQISQGLVLPLSVLPDPASAVPGQDVTELLGVTKYDPQAQQEQLLARTPEPLITNPLLKFVMKLLMRIPLFRGIRTWIKHPTTKSSFPKWIVKTDETRIQNMTAMFSREKDAGTRFSVTEKVDGQSATYFLRRVNPFQLEFGVCSRNLRLPVRDSSSYWKVAEKYHIQDVLKKLLGHNRSVVLQGEICGDRIQGNKYQIKGYELFAFNLIFPQRACSTAEMAKLLEPHGIRTVPLLEEGRLLPDTIAQLVDEAKGQSVVRPAQKREGLVMRSADGRISFKVINPEFLLEEKD